MIKTMQDKKEMRLLKFRSNFTIDVLDFLLGLPEGILQSFNRNDFYRILHGMPTEKVLTTSNICRIFHSFKQNGYIKTEVIDEVESIRFTTKSRMAIIDKLSGRTKPDGILRFVSFDVPERLRASRDKFRRTIKRLGFRQIQKSLWVCNKNIGDIVESASLEYGINDYIVYIAAEKTNIDDATKKILVESE